MDEHPNIGIITGHIFYDHCKLLAVVSKHPLALPIRRLSVLPDGQIAGIVNTKSKKGEIY